MKEWIKKNLPVSVTHFSSLLPTRYFMHILESVIRDSVTHLRSLLSSLAWAAGKRGGGGRRCEASQPVPFHSAEGTEVSRGEHSTTPFFFPMGDSFTSAPTYPREPRWSEYYLLTQESRGDPSTIYLPKRAEVIQVSSTYPREPRWSEYHLLTQESRCDPSITHLPEGTEVSRVSPT